MAASAPSKAEADRRVHGSQRAETTAVEGGVGGDDGMQILGAVPLTTPVVGTAAGPDPGQQPAGNRVQQPHPPWRSGQAAGMTDNSQPSRVRRPMMNETCSRPDCTASRPERRALQGTTWTSWKP
jgi:hypothetical protein